MDDLLIHKQIKEGERFPTIRYHVVTDQDTAPSTNAAVKDLLAKKLVSFVQANNKLPFACKFTKVFKNGAVQVDYTPTQYDNFALKVEPALVGNTDAQSFFQDKEVVQENPYRAPGKPVSQGAPAAGARSPGKTGKITSEPVIQGIVASNEGTVCIFDAEVTSIERRESKFQDEVTVFYLVHVKGGEAAPDIKKSTEHQKLSEIKVRLSENLVDEIKIAVGDKITFKGKLKDDKYFGLMLHNVKKVSK
jgi:hypothetical protein